MQTALEDAISYAMSADQRASGDLSRWLRDAGTAARLMLSIIVVVLNYRAAHGLTSTQNVLTPVGVAPVMARAAREVPRV